MRRTATSIAVVLLVGAMLSAIGCSANGAGSSGGGSQPDTPLAATTSVPPALSGTAPATSQAYGIRPSLSGSFVDITQELLDEWTTNYTHAWDSVPKISTYFNNEFGGFPEEMEQAEQYGITWEPIQTGPFEYEASQTGNDEVQVVRRNEAFTIWERLLKDDGNGEMRYSTYREEDGVTHSARVFLNIGGGDNHEILEMVETADYTFVKCLWWSNTSNAEQATLNHIVAVSDRSSAEGFTTARKLHYNPGDTTTHIIDIVPGLEADVDYHTDERTVALGLPNSDDIYGFLNDSEYYVSSTDENDLAWTAPSGQFSAYPDPDLLTALFDQGLTDHDWMDLFNDLSDGLDGIELTAWDLSAFE